MANHPPPSCPSTWPLRGQPRGAAGSRPARSGPSSGRSRWMGDAGLWPIFWQAVDEARARRIGRGRRCATERADASSSAAACGGGPGGGRPPRRPHAFHHRGRFLVGEGRRAAPGGARLRRPAARRGFGDSPRASRRPTGAGDGDAVEAARGRRGLRLGCGAGGRAPLHNRPRAGASRRWRVRGDGTVATPRDEGSSRRDGMSTSRAHATGGRQRAGRAGIDRPSRGHDNATMATTVYLGGQGLVCDGMTLPAPALVARDGRVAGGGARDAMTRLAGPGAETVDVRGATILPGFVDTHPHVMHFGAFAEPLVDIADARSHDEIAERIRARAAITPPGEGIRRRGVGEPHYFIRRSWRDLAEGRLPDRRVLDRAAPRHPVFIQAWAPVIPNVCAMNGLALERLRITRDSPDQVEHVWIEKDTQGEPTGILRGAVNNYYTNDPFMNALLREIPLLQPAAVLPGTMRAMAAYNQLGVTAVYEGHAMGPGEIAAWRMLRDQGALTLRVLTALEAESYGLAWTRPLSMAEFREHLEAALSMAE